MIQVKSAPASNLQIEVDASSGLVEWNDTNDTIKVEFDLSWEHAWDDSVNHDAVWVFLKYAPGTYNFTDTFSHGTLDARVSRHNPSGWSRGTAQGGSAFNVIDFMVSEDHKGVFIYPVANGDTYGTVDFHDVQIIWDAKTDTGFSTNKDYWKVRVFGVEMVEIPDGRYYLGDGNTSGNQIASNNNYYYVPNEEPLKFTTSTSGLYYRSSSLSGEDATGTAFIVPGAFPKGYKGVYAMKYEVSQRQYADFVNLIAPEANDDLMYSNRYQNEYVVTALTTGCSYRNCLKADASTYSIESDADNDNTGNESNDGEWVSMNFMTWMDFCALADWMALRPMTELEFEKIARGKDQSPVSGEYAWGSTSAASGSTITTAYTATETLSGNIVYNNQLAGPLRSGAVTSASDTRVNAGAGYYGNMDLSGNVGEMVVTLGNESGRAFAGTHGDGELYSDSQGRATNADWPGYDVSWGFVNGATGSGVRGGDYTSVGLAPRTSNRYFAALPVSSRDRRYGGRFVRDIPE